MVSSIVMFSETSSVFGWLFLRRLRLLLPFVNRRLQDLHRRKGRSPIVIVLRRPFEIVFVD